MDSQEYLLTNPDNHFDFETTNTLIVLMKQDIQRQKKENSDWQSLLQKYDIAELDEKKTLEIFFWQQKKEQDQMNIIARMHDT